MYTRCTVHRTLTLEYYNNLCVWEGKGSEPCTLGVLSIEPLPWDIIIICVCGRVRDRRRVHSVYRPSNPYPGISNNLCVGQGKGSEPCTLGVQSVEPLPWHIILLGRV